MTAFFLASSNHQTQWQGEDNDDPGMEPPTRNDGSNWVPKILLTKPALRQLKNAIPDVFCAWPPPDSSPEAQPKYIKGGKRYGRRSLPEFQESVEDFAEVTVIEPLSEEPHPAHIAASQEVSREGWAWGWPCHLWV